MVASIEFREISKVPLKNPILIEGFPGLGLVGTISATYLVDKLSMEQVGYIVSDDFPPLTAVHNHVPLHPARIYASKKHNLIVILSEFIVPLGLVRSLAEKILVYAKEKEVSRIISLGGIAIKGEQETVYAIATMKKDLDSLEKMQGVKLIKEGASTGVTGVLLAEGNVTKLPVISLLAEAQPEYMDPKAASMVLHVLNKLLELNIDTSELDKEAVAIESKMRDMMDKAKTSHARYKKAEAQQELGPMYG